MPRKLRAAVYARVSSAELQLEGYSLDAQQTACERLAQERGWEITAPLEPERGGATAPD